MADDARRQVYESLFEHPGWDLFVKDFITPAVRDVPVAAFEHATNIEEIIAARIVRDKLQIIEVLPEAMKQQWELDDSEEGEEYGSDDI